MTDAAPRTMGVLTPGFWGVLPTPFSGSLLDVDEPSLVRTAEHFVDVADVTGLVVLGALGEGSALSLEEQRNVLEIVASVRGSRPLVVGLPSPYTQVAIEQGQQVRELLPGGVAAVMVAVNSANPIEFASHLRSIHQATELGILIQDLPPAPGAAATMRAEDLVRVVKHCEFVVGVKCETPPTAVAVAQLRESTDVSLFGGNGGLYLLEELAAGAHGVMTGFSYPEALRQTIDAFDKDGLDGARETFLPWLPLIAFEAQPRVSLAIRKELMRARGLMIEAAVRPPSAGLPGPMYDLLDQHRRRADDLLGRR
jgi:4-hydroxy-tetrahydrodipicolinate synthase